jgi:hypothetical protein
MLTGRTEGLSRYWDLSFQSFTILLDRILFRMSYPSEGLTGLNDKEILADLFANRVVGADGGNGNSEITVGSHVQIGTKTLSAIDFIYTYAREAIEKLASYVGYSYYSIFTKNCIIISRKQVTPPSLSQAHQAKLLTGYRLSDIEIANGIETPRGY